MEILIIGGTQFVGRAMAEAALERGHRVTLFHRGQTNPGLFAGKVEEILGDRKADLLPLQGRHWDAVIDCVGYHPEVVAASCSAVSADAYAFVSTISVYPASAIDEDGPTLTLPEGVPTDPITGENYGPLKVLCENEVKKAFANALIIRAGLQSGEHDHTDRFNDWVERLMTRPKVAVPDDAMPWQMIDARDTAGFTLHCLENGIYDTFNVTGEATPMLDYLMRVKEALGVATELVEVDPESVKAVAEPWDEVTLWFPADQRDTFPLAVPIEKAKRAGMVLRPLAETIQGIANTIRSADPDRKRRGGLSREKEEEILRRVRG